MGKNIKLIFVLAATMIATNAFALTEEKGDRKFVKKELHKLAHWAKRAEKCEAKNKKCRQKHYVENNRQDWYRSLADLDSPGHAATNDKGRSCIKYFKEQKLFKIEGSGVTQGADPKIDQNDIAHAAHYCEMILMTDVAYHRIRGWVRRMFIKIGGADHYRFQKKLDRHINRNNNVAGQDDADMRELQSMVNSKQNLKELRKQLYDYAMETYKPLLEIKFAAKELNPAAATGGPTVMQANGSFGSNSADSREEAGIDLTDDQADKIDKLADQNAATEAYRNIDDDDKNYNKGMEMLAAKNIDPEDFMDHAEEFGIAAAIDKANGNPPGTSSYLDDMEKNAKPEVPAAMTPALAYDSARSAGGSAKKESNPFGDLLGNRGPASGDGGLKEIKFSGVNANDIWHTGTNMSIFEIVNKKTVEVTGRVGGI